MSGYGEHYLGHGLYVRFDGFVIWLRAPRDGVDHFVGLEPEVWRMLMEWRRALDERLAAANRQPPPVQP